MKWISLILILIFALPIVSAKDLVVREANIVPEHNDIFVSMSVEKSYNSRTKMNFAVTMFDYDLRLKKTDHVADQKITSKRFYVDMPNQINDGCYVIRLTASNNDLRRVKHREICVKNGIIY
jgi:hypothetical protein